MKSIDKNNTQKKLSARDLAFGIGRKATSKELTDLINNTTQDSFISLDAFEKKIIKTNTKHELTNKIK